MSYTIENHTMENVNQQQYLGVMLDRSRAISFMKHIKCLTRKKQRAYNWACSTNSESDWVKYKDIKRQCQYECRKCFNQYVSTLIDPNSNVKKSDVIYEDQGPDKVRDLTKYPEALQI